MDAALKSKLWSITSYIPPVFALTLFLKRADPLALLHAKQATVLWAIVICIIPVVFIPILGPALSTVIWLLCAYLLIRALIRASIGSKRPVPILGELVTITLAKLDKK